MSGDTLGNDRKLLSRLPTLLPPIVAGVGALLTRVKFQPFTFNSESAFVALCFAFVVSTIFSMRLVFGSREKYSASSWIAGFDVIVLPFVACEVAIGALAVGWLLGSIIALWDFRQTGAAPVRLIAPASFALIAIIIGRLQMRPSHIQRVWELADAKNGLRKLKALCRTAQEADDLTTLHAIAKMPRMSPVLLAQLASHQSGEIRADVANNPNTAADDLLKLSRDVSIDVRRAVAFNSAVGGALLRTLTHDADEGIREKAQSRLREREVMP